ncbi:hypothetical protein AtNW77_Chr4g0308441 [Arabidopsis thaliana]|uniref:Uncharacterized protein n=3 Tax=Arabidopsis TaxID=3701 RepID=A0A178V402_ARATH|nr:hypothetical protein ISN45_At04g032030 [Arabidopsis thaliana x Arabidopsis arenosa]KAG7622340.1 hypothetical protein ISN44_As04g031470 [Arabidopsis suecica]OAP00338.1 hypothetical protein AXX17_AT4G34660 [Arabidopsis thaliana]CAA0396998.1 unnamed protein product [Arabidopsis thaliana]VYS64410.1 unnamed protein product [Arabidopsis thaliana]
METTKNTNLQNPTKLPKPFQHHLEEEKEDALSLRDLPLKAKNPNPTTTEDHKEPSTELFEFLTSSSYDVAPAENIIFGGKLIPLNYQNALFSPPEHISRRIRSRSESLSAIQGHKLNRPGSCTVARRDNAGPMRASRSLDYRKLSRGLTTVHSPPENSSPTKNTGKPETTSSGSVKSVRPRWYVIMFGMVKFPPEIELKDIKSRQIRRNIPPVMFPSPANRRARGSRSPSPSPSWRFLNALSCKKPTSVAATAPFWVPHP